MTCWYHSTPSKLCDACMREQAKAAPAAPTPSFTESIAAYWELRAQEFTAEKQREAAQAFLTYLIAFGGPDVHRYRAWVSGWYTPRRPAPQSMTVTAVDSERGAITFSSAAKRLEAECDQAYRDMLVYGSASMLLDKSTGEVTRLEPSGLESWLPKAGDGASFLSVERTESAVRDAVAAKRSALQAMEYHEACRAIVGVLIDKNGEATPLRHEDVERHETFRLGARGCHVGATVRHRGDPLSGLMTVTAINSVVDRVCCVDANGDKREFGLSGGWLVLVNGSGR
jgi:hypothetical protein